MLISRDDRGPLAIGQLSHSWLAGQLARAWGNELFGSVEPHEAVALGAEQHDIGWALFDLEPRLNPDTGLPRSFLELTVEDHLAIWATAPDQLFSQSLHAALVVSMHGSSLSELRCRLASDEGPAELRQHIADEHQRQAWLRSVLGVSEAQAERIRRQMWTWDGLSLALCNGWRPFTARDVPSAEGLIDVELRERDELSLTLDPWPFAVERVTVRCEARRLRDGYQDELQMRRHLAEAKPIMLTFDLHVDRDL